MSFRPTRASARFLAAFAASIAVLAAGAGGALAADWVGLGDSYAAGPLIPNQSLSPLGCLRSDHNFAHLAAAQDGMSLADASCSGATTANMTGSQPTSVGTNPPQFNALSASTKVVSLEIGGNDIGFTSILENCVTYNPFSHPCKDKYIVGGDDRIADSINAAAPKVAAVLQGIHARSPSARVLVVNYAVILPNSGSGCWPQVPLAYADVPYLRSKEQQLNAMLATQAAANNARLVDDATPSAPFNACTGSGTRWVEPLVPGNAAAPFHPNARGEAGIAGVVAPAGR
jgi:GDSL-like Lipase/Acylhydrolase family